MKKIIRNLITAVVATTLCLTGCGSAGTADKSTDSTKSTEKSAQESTQTASGSAIQGKLSGKHHAKITVKDYGTIEVELDADQAPITVTNFAKLVQKGFYDGLTFHRIISGFMIQGGDPDGNGTGGPGYEIKGEFSANGFKNDLKHTLGVLSMARTMIPDSAGSQFFIMVADAPHLDGQYAAFGKITENAQAAVDISRVNRNMYNDMPKKPQVIKTIRVDTQGVDYPEPEKM